MRISVGAFIPAAPFQAIASRASRRSPAGSGPTHRQTLPLGGVCVNRTSMEPLSSSWPALSCPEPAIHGAPSGALPRLSVSGPALSRRLACLSWTLKPWSSLRSKMDEAVLERGHIGQGLYASTGEKIRCGYDCALSILSASASLSPCWVRADLSPPSNCRTFRLG